MRNVLQTHRVLFRFRSDSKSNCAPWGVKCGTSFIQRYITDTQIWPDHKQILRISKQSHMRQLRHRSHIVYISHRSPHRFLLPLLACPRPSSLQPHQASHLHTAASLRTHLQAFPFLESDRDRNTWLLREELEDLEWRIHLG